MAGMSMNQIIAAQGSRRASRPRPLPSRAENPFQPRAQLRPSASPAAKRASNPGNHGKRDNPVVVGARPAWGAGWYGAGWNWPGMWGWGAYPYGRYALPVATVAAPVYGGQRRRPHPSVVLAAAAPYASPYGGWWGGGWGGGWPYARAGYGVTAVS